jgi:protocatechuate 3,4-dioxygenase beta subunit
MCKTGLFLVVFSVLASAQETPSTTDTSKVASIEGVVVNELTKEPIRKVEISLRKQGAFGGNAAYSAVTDAAGKFRVESIEPGEYMLMQRKTGFIVSRSNYGFSARLLKLGAGQALTGLRYNLLPQGLVSGRVVDDEGEPVQNIYVTLMRSSYYRGSNRIFSMGRPQPTNDRGEFRFTDVQPGRYFLQADVQRMVAMTGGVLQAPSAAPGAPKTAFVSTFYPSASEIAQATRIEVQAGQELAGRDIALTKEKVVRVTGKVLNASGSPVKQAFVNILRADPSITYGAVSFAPVDENGKFTANNVPPGQYKVRAMKGDGSDWQSGETSIDVGDNGADNVVVQLQPALEAKGAFILEGSDRKDFDFSTMQVTLQAVGDTDYNSAFGQSKSDGTFSISQLTSGHYTLDVYTGRSEEGYVKAIFAGTEDVLGKEVDANAIAAAGLKIVIRLDSATLAGTVEVPDERKAFLRSPSVVLLPADAQLRKANQRIIGQLNQDNGFSLKNLRPGDYIAFAFEESDYASLQDPEVFAVIESKGTAVSLAANESKSLSLKILPWPEQFADRLQ